MGRDFGGSTDRIDYANVLSPGGNPQTWSFLVYPDSIAANQYLLIVHHTGDTATAFLIHTHSSGSGRVGVIVQNDGGSNMVVATDNDTIATGVWQHVLIHTDGSNTATNLHVFVDGVEASYNTQSDGDGTIRAGDGSWSIGGRIWDDTRNFDGRLANLGMWNRELTAGEIAALAAGYAPATIPRGLKWAPDLVRHQRDHISGKTGTLDGTTVVAHPRTIWPVPSFKPWAGAAAITGTLTQTLGDVSISAAGELDIEATLSQTLGDDTLSATGELDIEGTLAQTLGGVSISAAGELDIEGTLAQTLGGVSISAAGELDIAGALTQTLADDALSATGELDIAGTLTQTLGGVSISAAGELDIAGTAAITLADLVLAAVATLSTTTVSGSVSGPGSAVNTVIGPRGSTTVTGPKSNSTIP